MKLRMLILALVGVTAGAMGTVASRVLMDGGAAASTTQSAQTVGRPAAEARLTSKQGDDCGRLVRKVRSGSLSDARLERLLKRYPRCRAVVVDSTAPVSGGGTQVVTLTAPAQTAPSATSPVSGSYDDDGYEDDDHYEDEDHEDEDHEDEEHEGFEEEDD
jgi:hypothetical protein